MVPYAYGTHSQTTDDIYRALDALKDQEQAENPKKAEKSHELPKLKGPLSRFTKNKMQPEVLLVYEKQVRGSLLENYAIIKAAARRELEQNKDLTPANRNQLFRAIRNANVRILRISKQFYKHHPVAAFKTAPGEGIKKILLEQKSLIEANIRLISRETKENEINSVRHEEALTEISQQIKHTFKKIKKVNKQLATAQANGHPTAELEREQTQLQALLATQKRSRTRIKKKAKELVTRNRTLKTRGVACVDALNKVLQKIAKSKSETQKQLEPNAFLNFVATQIPDTVLTSPAEELLDVTGAYDASVKEGKSALTNLGTAILALGRDLIVAKGKDRWKVFKNKVIHSILPLAGLYAGISLIYTYGPAVIAALGSAFVAAKAFFISTAALIGLTNPVGAVILGVAISGLAIYGLGLLISKNKAFLVKVFTPITTPICWLAKGLACLYKMIKERTSPDIHVSLKLKPLPKSSEEMTTQLQLIAAQATSSAGKAKVNGELAALRKQLVTKTRESLEEAKKLRLNRLTKEIERDNLIKAGNQDAASRLAPEIARLIEQETTAARQSQEAIADLKGQIRTKERELSGFNEEIQIRERTHLVQKTVSEINDLHSMMKKASEKIKKNATSTASKKLIKETANELKEISSKVRNKVSEVVKLIGLEAAQLLIIAKLPDSDNAKAYDWMFAPTAA